MLLRAYRWLYKNETSKFVDGESIEEFFKRDSRSQKFPAFPEGIPAGLGGSHVFSPMTLFELV